MPMQYAVAVMHYCYEDIWAKFLSEQTWMKWNEILAYLDIQISNWNWE